MRTSETLARKARSPRARHNGRINADKARILNSENAIDKTFSDGTKYKVHLFPFKYPTGSLNEDGTPEHGTGIKSQYVRVSEQE